LRLLSPTPETTEALGAALAAALDDAGAVVVLSGPLGAGKTRFVKGLASGLGIPASRVQSPTFVIAQELPRPGGGVLVHVDCYRVGSEAELLSAGLLDWLAPGALVVAEWGERVPEAWPDARLEIGISREGDARTLEARARGGAGPRALLERWRQHAAALSPAPAS
jgi:tRNA threonylcarbamoyladenosine biosynthesis protein TsaE